VIIVGCGKAKLAHAAPAAELYTGSLFRAARRYAEARGDAWAIASAHWGLVWPEQVIEPYDRRLMPGSEHWARRCVERLLERTGGPVFVELLAGATYAEPLSAALWRAGCANSTPLEGLGLGKRLAYLTSATAVLVREREASDRRRLEAHAKALNEEQAEFLTLQGTVP
jgi:hypothetical protein